MFIEEINLGEKYIIPHSYLTITRHSGDVSDIEIINWLSLDGEYTNNNWKFYGMGMKDW